MTNQANCPEQDSCSVIPRFRFDLHFLFAAIAIAVVWLAALLIFNTASLVVLAIYGLTYLFGCWKTRRAVLWLLPAMYLPYLWLFGGWQGWPQGENPWHWISMYVELPGILAGQLVSPLSAAWLHVLTAGCTLIIFFAAVMLARPSPKYALFTAVMVLLASIGNSIVCGLAI